MIFKTHIVTVTLPNIASRFNIIPIGDVHRETKSCDVNRWKKFIADETKELKPWDLMLGIGDWNDFVSASERSKLKSMKLHESTIEGFDKDAKGNCDDILGELEHTKGHWIGLIQGNHRWDFTTGELNGMSSDEYMAKELNCTMLEDLAYITIRVKFANNNKSVSIGVVASHGKAGGKLAGTTLNQVDDLRKIFPNADMYIMGHDHRKIAVPMSSLDVKTYGTKSIVKERVHMLVRSGSFKRAYVEGQDNYEVGQYHPNSLGYVIIDCGIRRTLSGGKDELTPDIHVRY